MPSAAVNAVLDVLDLARSDRFAEIPSRFAPNLRSLVQPEVLEQAWTAELDRRGAIAAVGALLTEPVPPATTLVKIPVACARGGFTLVAAATDAGHLLSLQLAPPEAAAPTAAWEPPAYADPGAFAEEEVTLESGPRAVGGTLTAPRAGGPRAAIVLLAGSGSLDRDETVRASKPFKDLAWGLATRGVAVLRFDKVTYAHAAELKGERDFTLTDEYVPQALAAIRLLQAHAERVFVLGHSLGGAVAPRVAAAAPAVAGLVLLAGSAQPLHWAIVRQARHLASLDPASDARPVLAALTEQAERVDRGELTGELPLGAPAAYWADLRDHRPAELAATLGKPMLILQGGRDYQVTVADDLALWRAAVPDATFRVYPALNHLFAPGEGPPSPAEYERPQHVDRAVIQDIADWLG